MIAGSVAAAFLIVTVVVMRAVFRHRRTTASGIRNLGAVSQHWLLTHKGDDR